MSNKEIPFAISDIVQPGSDDRAEEIYSDKVIPIFSFRGSPVKAARSQPTSARNYSPRVEDSYSDSKKDSDFMDLETYFSKMKMNDGTENDQEGQGDGDGGDNESAEEEGENPPNNEDDDFDDYLLNDGVDDDDALEKDFEDYLDEEPEPKHASGVVADENDYGNDPEFENPDEDDALVPAYGTQLPAEVQAEVEEELESWRRYKDSVQNADDENQDQNLVVAASTDYDDVFEQMDVADGSILDLVNEAAISSIDELTKTEGNISAELVKGIMDEYNDMIAALRSPRPRSQLKSASKSARLMSGEVTIRTTISPQRVSVTNKHYSPLAMKKHAEDEESDENQAENIFLDQFGNEIDLEDYMEFKPDQYDEDTVIAASARDGGGTVVFLPKDNSDGTKGGRAAYPIKKIGVVKSKKRGGAYELYQKHQKEQERIKGKAKPPVANKSKIDAAEKHKQWLASVQEKRRQEDEALLAEAQRAVEKRKKFKEALLEKARKARLMEEQTEEEDLAPEEPLAQQPPMKAKARVIGPPAAYVDPKKKLSEEAATVPSFVTASECIRAEDERKEQVAQIRRKFKEQHKKILLALMEKKRLLDLKAEEDQKIEQLKKEKHRQKALALAAKREAAFHAAVSEPVNDVEEAKPVDVGKSSGEKRARKQREQLERSTSLRNVASELHSAASGNNEGSKGMHGAGPAAKDDSALDAHYDEPGVAQSMPRKQKVVPQVEVVVAGSALAAVRSRSHGSTSDGRRQQKTVTAQQNALVSPRLLEREDDVDEGGVRETKAVAKKPRESSKSAATEKLAAYIEGLAASKRKEEADLKRKEERAKKRMALLSERIRQEALERKLMNLEDAIRHRIGVVCTSSAPKEKVLKVTADAVDAMVSRLAAKPKDDGTAGMSVPARDYADWKRKNGVPADGLVFSMTGWYPCVKQALLDRGWFFNPESSSPYFDLKWTLRSIDVEQETLQPWQLTNHFLKNVAITTKAGLLKSLQSVVWLADVSMNDIIPRGYDLSNPVETQAFIDDFRCQRAASILKKLYKEWTGFDRPAASILQAEGEGVEAPVWSRPKTPALNDASGSREFNKINKAVFDACCAVLEKLLRPTDDEYIDEQDGEGSMTTAADSFSNELISGIEWEVISNYDIYKPSTLPGEPMELVDAFLREKEDTETKSTAVQHRERKKRLAQDKAARESAAASIGVLRAVTLSDLRRVHNILSRLQFIEGSQSGLNGNGMSSNNIWIVKPAAKSRGRGITTFNDLPKLLKYVEAGSGLSTQWIVQKYMENPLLIAKRKFDMRQWVLVTDWNPVTVYFFDEFYARFSVEEYDNTESALDNCYVHLVNNSIGKNSENFNKVVQAENGVPIEGYMWSHETFSQYIQGITGEDTVRTKIQPRMKELAKWSLMCASEMIEHRKNSWELYGFDFMVDDEYNAWLIEINSSPACDYSTKVTERYVQKALVELLSVVLDTRKWEVAPKKTRGEKPDTGGWECIHKGPLLEAVAGSFGTDMTLKGEAIKQKRQPQQAAPAVVISASSGESGGLIVQSVKAPTANPRPPANPIPLDRDLSLRGAKSLSSTSLQSASSNDRIISEDDDDQDVEEAKPVAKGSRARISTKTMKKSPPRAAVEEAVTGEQDSAVGIEDDDDLGGTTGNCLGNVDDEEQDIGDFEIPAELDGELLIGIVGKKAGASSNLRSSFNDSDDDSVRPLKATAKLVNPAQGSSSASTGPSLELTGLSLTGVGQTSVTNPQILSNAAAGTSMKSARQPAQAPLPSGAKVAGATAIPIKVFTVDF